MRILYINVKLNVEFYVNLMRESVDYTNYNFSKEYKTTKTADNTTN